MGEMPGPDASKGHGDPKRRRNPSPALAFAGSAGLAPLDRSLAVQSFHSPARREWASA